MADKEIVPIPTQMLGPWIDDNKQFIDEELPGRTAALDDAPRQRAVLLDMGAIRAIVASERCSLEAVDAAMCQATIGDMISLLFQVVRVADDGVTTLGKPLRITGIDGQKLNMMCTPTRLMIECEELASSRNITIADTSLWSDLWYVNQVIADYRHRSHEELWATRPYEVLVRNGVFLEMLRNTNVIAMSKTNQSCLLSKDGTPRVASDREILRHVLQAGEFLVPKRLVEGTKGNFGIEEQSGFTGDDREEIRHIYEHQLGVTYFHPHAASRVFRIEGHLACMQDDAWLMALLSAITWHTRAQTIIEPYPQFMADFTAKKLGNIASLYGEKNLFRSPYFDPSRTL